MSPLNITLLGTISGILTTGAWLPQVVKSWRSRSAADFSWGYLGMFAAGVFLWAAYGVVRRDIAVTGTNVVTFVLVASVAMIKMGER
jgi:MtN3 and saliva related transmembrane protein